MTVKNIIFAVVFLGSFAFFAYSVRRLIRMLRIGKPEGRFENPGARLKRTLIVAIGQSKLLREPAAGMMHALIFWGFLVLLTSVVESIGEGLMHGFSLKFLGPLYPVIAFSGDLFGGFVILAVLYALYRRIVIRPQRLEVGRHG